MATKFQILVLCTCLKTKTYIFLVSFTSISVTNKRRVILAKLIAIFMAHLIISFIDKE